MLILENVSKLSIPKIKNLVGYHSIYTISCLVIFANTYFPHNIKI